MNKRQRKKKKKKYLPVIADEHNLISMTDEERELAIKEYEKFVEKYAYRKKYKNLKGKYLNYYYPVGKTARESLRKISELCSKKNCSTQPIIVKQSISDINIRNDLDINS